MPRWKELPEELDPQMREFVGQLRGLVDHGGLSPAAVADRTGYSKTSWERYLNGRLLAPKGAIVALAEVTGTQQHHLTTMWELAERSWSRSEMRHDMTMEAIRISQARAAPGAAGVAAAPVAGRRAGRPDSSTRVPAAAGPEGGAGGIAHSPSVPGRRVADPRIPRQPRPGDAPDSGGDGHRAGGGSRERRESGRRRLPLILGGAVGVLLLTVGAVLLAGGSEGEDEDEGSGAVAATTPSADPGTSVSRLPSGVGCSGADCAGADPETMGCGGRFAATVARTTLGGALVEVRYSRTCEAAWGRVTRASEGDTVRITAGPSEQNGTVEAGADAYTPMVAVRRAADAEACAVRASGESGCTTPG
ncbi:DUF2690 domain-containing protein [Streptomyces sp. NPDC005752]|uniref:helix-turn-helix domain-containing protein n=1 Tax=Streptomyces sp. NPDC005752 TaxID=3157065 RepID=UPI0033D809D3